MDAATTEAIAKGLTGKAARTWKLLEEHEQRMATKRGLREFRCGGCQALIAHYIAPVAMVLWSCGCGHINKLSISWNGHNGGGG